MTTFNRYPSPPLGETLGRFYDHRSVLRRTIPLFSLTTKDLARFLRGEAAMASNERTATISKNSSDADCCCDIHSGGHRPVHA